MDVQCGSSSSILHGEAGRAGRCRPSLCHILKDPGAQEYAANQTREEARHVAGFSNYIKTRWGKPAARSARPSATLLTDTRQHAGGLEEACRHADAGRGPRHGRLRLASTNARADDPLMVKLMQLTMTDEAFHHKFGKIWADRTIPNLDTEAAQNVDRGLGLAEVLPGASLQSRAAPSRRSIIYAAVGLELGMGAGRHTSKPSPTKNVREQHAGKHQHLPCADQDAAEGRHHHRPHQGHELRRLSST